MRIRATCGACGRDFLFFQLRHADPWAVDRCPHCQRPLGVRGVLPVRAEQALSLLVASLEDLARHNPNFTVRQATVLRPIEEALAALTAPEAASGRTQARRWWQRPATAA